MDFLKRTLLPITLLASLVLGFNVAPARADVVISAVTTGGDSQSQAVDTVRDKIYLVNNDGHSVTVIDGMTESVSNVPVGWNISAHQATHAAGSAKAW
jgi:DNA-binding beta-propeller fold protein YncE